MCGRSHFDLLGSLTREETKNGSSDSVPTNAVFADNSISVAFEFGHESVDEEIYSIPWLCP